MAAQKALMPFASCLITVLEALSEVHACSV